MVEEETKEVVEVEVEERKMANEFVGGLSMNKGGGINF